MSIFFKTERADGIKTGDSKLLGDPHVWEGFEWPLCEVDGENYDLTFMCQINCADACIADGATDLPSFGMLYFFYDLDGMPDVSRDKKDVRVLYYDGYTSMLGKMMLTDEKGEGISLPEQKIIFSSEPQKGSPRHLLIGTPAGDGDISGWTLLLQIDSFETDEANINFCGEHTLNFYIHPEKLKNRDFSDVCVMRVKNKV